MQIDTDTAAARIIAAIQDAAPAPRSIAITQHGGPIRIDGAHGPIIGIRDAAGAPTHDTDGMPIPAEERAEIDMAAIHRALRDRLPAAFPGARIRVACFW